MYAYAHQLGNDRARTKMEAKVSTLLGPRTPGSGIYEDDFLGTFAAVVESPFHIPDSWAAVERLAPVLDARLADYESTAFEIRPDLSLYRKAVKLRDARTVTPDRMSIPKATAEATTTPQPTHRRS